MAFGYVVRKESIIFLASSKRFSLKAMLPSSKRRSAFFSSLLPHDIARMANDAIKIFLNIGFHVLSVTLDLSQSFTDNVSHR